MRIDDVRSRYDNKHFLFGLFFSFGNRLQAAGDAFYDEITSKQFFLSTNTWRTGRCIWKLSSECEANHK